MKGIKNLNSLFHRSKLQLKRASPTILTYIGAIGVVATSVMAVRATPKALDFIKEDSRQKHDGDPYAYTKIEAVQSCWRCYIPTAFVGLSTISCIFGANILNKRNQASLVSAYAMLSESYKQYREAAKSLYGEDADSKIIAEVAKKKYISADGCYIHDPDSVSEELLFYDSFSQRYFTSTMSSVLNAQYHVNRNFALRGWSDLNELYDFLGLEEHSGGDVIGWSSDEMLEGGLTPWIDFENRLVEMDDGLECYIISTLFEPTVLDSDYN